ncbi:hypothetical protein D3Z36_06930 [Lachnospiraceae bacterium]|nr:hypothetical protein [Lachnospiraceae bacterium]
MKLKKIILGILFFTAVSVPFQAWASGTLSGVGLLAGKEEKEEPDIYQVTLPTDRDLEVVLDPEGLLSIHEQGKYDSSWSGQIHMKQGKGALFINRSSFPVMVRVGISIGQNRKGTPSTIGLLESDSNVNDGVWPQMYLCAIPGAAKIESMDDFMPSDTNIPIEANGGQELTEFSFLLDRSEYVQDEKTGEYVLADYEDNYDSASFVLGGKVNKNADWSSYTGKNKEHLVIRTVYTIQKQSYYDEQRLYQADGEGKMPYALIGK